MFTGIILEKGVFLKKIKGNNKYQLKIKARKVLKDLKRGDSIAVNGVCLTVVDFGENYFKADVMPTTLKATNLGDLDQGALLNLEPSLKPASFLGGHFVTGHVDSTALVKSIQEDANAKIIEFRLNEEISRFLVAKGSVTLNGVSLTVAEIDENNLIISLIPESWEQTNLSLLSVGDQVNIETDILAKYVFKMLKTTENRRESREKTKISKNFLAENGFI